MEQWMAEYEKQLAKAVAAFPTEYAYPVEDVPIVAQRMRAAFRLGSYSKSGRAIKACCKVLGIKCTYTAINQFIRGEQPRQ
jgi:hypothetical protein